MKEKIKTLLFFAMLTGFAGLVASFVFCSQPVGLLSGVILIGSISINLMVNVLQISKF